MRKLSSLSGSARLSPASITGGIIGIVIIIVATALVTSKVLARPNADGASGSAVMQRQPAATDVQTTTDGVMNNEDGVRADMEPPDREREELSEQISKLEDPIETFKRLNAEQQRSLLTALLKQLSGGKRYVFHNRPKPYWWPDSVDHSGVNVLKEPEREELYKHLVDLLSSESVPEVTFEKFQKAVDQLRQTPPPPHGRPPPPYSQQYGMPPPPLAVDPAASPWSTSASTFSQQYTMPPPPPVGNPAAAPWSTSAATYSQQYGMPPPPPACNPAAAPWSTSAATYSQQYGMPQPPPAGNPAAAPRSTSDATYSQQYGMPPPPPAGNPAAPPRSTSDATFSQQYTMPPPLPACNPAAAPWSTSAATYSQQYGMPPPPPAGNPAAAPRSTSDATFSQQYGMPPPPPAGNPAASPQSTSVATLPQQYTMPPPPPAGNPAAAPRSTSAATLPQQYTMPPPPPAGNPAAAPSKSTPVSANGTRPPYVSPDDESPADEPDVEAEWMRVMQPNVWRDTYTSTGSKKYGPEDVIVHYKPNPRVEVVLTRDKLQNSMAPLACVADEVIDLFTGLLQANADEGLTGQDVLVVPVFIPPPKGDTAEKPCGHWVCAVIDVQGKSITVYDSFHADRSEITANLLRWIDDATTRFGNRINQAEWTQHTPPNVVQQGNDKDCGIFTMLFAYLVGRRIAVPGRGASIDVTTLRKYFLYMLVTKVVDLPPLCSKLH
ncbi:Sentrin-specific protease 2 [Pleodorina starrii]|nr:Sentrin-specific protease 2 [Pleodorina starrii]